MKSYKENNKKNNKLIDAIEELILIFVVATISIVLYDIYINTDTASQQSYETLKTAKEIGLTTIGGLDMLVYQAQKAFKIFTGKQPDFQVMKTAAELYV